MNEQKPHGRNRALAAGLGVFVLAQVVAGWIIASATGWSRQTAYDSFLIFNSSVAASFAICGSIIAFHRPRNAVGWLFIAGGVSQGTSALMTPLMDALNDAGAPQILQRLAATGADYAWSWFIAVFLPLSLMLLPDGKLPSPRWRPVVWALAGIAPLFVVSMGAEPVPVLPGRPLGHLKLPFFSRLGSLWLFAEVRTLAFMLVALLSLFVVTGGRKRRSSASCCG